MLKSKYLSQNSLFFPIAMWLSSRLLIVAAMLLVAPLLPNPSNTTITFGWDVFSAWDSEFYRKIATSGYDFSMKKREFSVAFFPLFPLLIRAVMSIGFSFEMAGTLVNNLAFLAALIILYFWIEERYSTNAARWSTAVLIWCPYSIYGTIIYTEGLFLLCSIAALRAFDKQQYILAAFWGALSTATRSPGLALIPAFLFMSWKERRGIKAYSASFAVSLGILLYSLYCQIQFGDALAFVHAQKGWRESAGFAWQGWLKMLMQIVVGKANWQNGKIVDIWHPLLFLLIICGGYLLWQFHQRLGLDKVHYGLYTLWLLLWLLVGDELIKSVVIFGGFGLLLLSKNQIPLVTFIYGICAYSLIFNTGITASAERYVYGIVSMAIAFGLLLTRYPRLGYAIISFFAILLLLFSIRFAQNQWVA